MVGLFVGLAMILLLGGFAYFLWHTADAKGWFKRKVPYFTLVSDGTGVQVGAEVKMTGFKIGEVTKVETMPMEEWVLQSKSFVFIRFEVVEPYFGYILQDSSVRLGAGDLLGTRSLEVTRGVAGLVTVTNLPNGRLGHLGKDFKKTGVKYIEVNDRSEGFLLAAAEQQPLPEKLTAIANDIHTSLPGVLGMTNAVNLVLSNLTSLTMGLNSVAPMLSNTLGDARGLLSDLRPLATTPGGIGDLLIPTNLNSGLSEVLSNLNARSESLAPALSNLTAVITSVGGLVSNLNTQLGQETNLLLNVSRLADHAGELAVSTDTLLRHHWLFRSAFKTNRPATTPPVRPRQDRGRF